MVAGRLKGMGYEAGCMVNAVKVRISLLRVTRDWMGNAVILVPWRALQGATVWTFAMCEVTLEYPGVEDAADEFTRTQVNSRLTHSFCLASTYC
jgi:hypothetical protein